MNSEIDYMVTRCKRRTLCIKVFPNLKVEVRAPLGVKEGEILAFVNKNRDWIGQVRKRFQKEGFPFVRTYMDGDDFPFLGKNYKLKVMKAETENVALEDDSMVVYSPVPDTPNYTRKILRKWYRQQAEHMLIPIYSECRKIAEGKSLLPPETFILKTLRRQWGSCNVDGKIVLNSELIKASHGCICCVIMHEFCHLKHFNHGHGFYRLLKELFPDYKHYEKQLKQLAETEFQ